MSRTSLLRRNILLYRLLLVLGANGLMTSVIYFFLTVTRGFNPSQALFLIGLGALAKAISEVPTGVIADKFSRKYSILIGYVVILISWIGILAVTGFIPMFLFVVLGGIGGSFISGADDALLYDSLKELDISDKFKQISNKSESIELFAFAATILIGGVLGGINLYFPILANIILLIVSVVITSLFVEPQITEKGTKIEQIGYLLHTKKSIKTIFSRDGLSSGLFPAFMSLALILAVFKSTKNILSPVLSQYDIAVPMIGLVISGIILIKAFGAYIASKISKVGKERQEVEAGLAICIAGLILISIIPSPIIKLLIFVVIIGFDNIILTNLSAIVNENVMSNQRSTILSLLSLFARSSEMLFLTSFGWIITSSVNYALCFTAGWLVFTSLVLQGARNKDILR